MLLNIHLGLGQEMAISWLGALICPKNDFSGKVFKIEASNSPEMFIGSLSTTFLLGPRSGNGYFSIWLRQYALKMIFLEKFSRWMLQTFQKCSLDHYLQLLQRLYGVFRILTAVKSKKLRFLIKKSLFPHFLGKYIRYRLQTSYLDSSHHYIHLFYRWVGKEISYSRKSAISKSFYSFSQHSSKSFHPC